MPAVSDLQPRYFLGDPTNMGIVESLPETTFADLVANVVCHPVALPLTQGELLALPVAEQNERKKTKYLVPSVFKTSPSARQTGSATHCNLLFADIDDSKEAQRMLNAGFMTLLGDLNAVVYHTARSTSENPRLRIVVPTLAPVPVAQYGTVVNALAGMLGMSSLNKESQVAVQPMYLPVQYKGSTDDPVIYVKTDGQDFDVSQLGQLDDLHKSNDEDADGATMGDIEYLRAPDETVTLAIASEWLDHLDPDFARHSWMNVAASLRHQFPTEPEAGQAYELFDAWSARAKAKYKGRDDTKRMWKSLTPNPKDRAPITIGTLRQMASRAGCTSACRQSAPWPAPIPLDLPIPPNLDLNRAIPSALGVFRDFIVATAESVQVPVDAVASLAIGVVAAAASRAFEIRLLPQWLEISVLWIAALAEPGERKSALLSKLTAPLPKWQANERRLLGQALALYSERRKADEARLVVLRRKIATASSNGKQAVVATLETAAQAVVQRLESTPELVAPELLTADFTPEAARRLMVSNGEKLIFASAETDFQQLTGSRYTNKGQNGGQNLNLMLAGKTGDSLPGHRVNRSEPLDRPAIGIVIFVQPTAVCDVLRDGNANGRGLVPRFAFVQAPSRMGHRALNPPQVPPMLDDWWEATVHRILDVPWPGRVVLLNNVPIRAKSATRVLDIDAPAQAVFSQLRQDIEGRLKEDGDLRPISAFASKLPGEIARIALSLELMQDPNATMVTGATMAAACQWAEFLIAHHRAVLGGASESYARRHARRLVASLHRNPATVVTERDCFRRIKNTTDLTTMADLPQVLVELVQTHHLRPVTAIKPAGPGHPPSPQYEVNPGIFAI